MDSSPVIIDNATKFGRDLDPRTHFPGFPFDDEGGFGRRSDIRSHLDDLAARHPEFADHLLGSAWDEVPFSAGSLRRGNRRPSQERPSANNIFHNPPDEDARSQASGGSAASGASGVSSHGSEAEQAAAAASAAETDSSPSARKIPQYNLRNTVDIGQHQHNMEAPQQQRNVRSMSAPPENRQNEPRFVSRVDINPQQEAQQQQQMPPPPQQQQTQQEPQTDKSPPPQAQSQQQEHKTARQQSNVRQIPIFVEGRDKPVIARDIVDEPDFPRRQSPPQFTRPSQHYQSFNRQPPGWTSHFNEPFFEPPQNRWTNSPPSHPQFRQPQQQQQEKPRYTYQAETQPRAKQQFQPQQQQQQQQQHKPQQHPQNEPQQEQAPPKPRQQVQPKDPLDKVAAVQQEVDALAEQVKEYSGNSRKEKQYMYLDEMLTRELIKLDDIDTEGKDNVRTARKQAIKSIQDTISLLESKAPLPGQQTPQPAEKQDAKPAKQEEQTVEQSTEKKEEAVAVKPEAMETQQAPAQEEHKAIPLPPPSSPTKEQSAAEAAQSSSETTAATVVVVAEAAPLQVQPEQVAREPQIKSEPMDATPTPQEQQQQPQEQPMEVRQSSPAKELQLGKEDQQQSQALIAAEQKQEVKEAAATSEQTSTEKPKKEPPPVPAKPNRSPKKAKKAAKQKSEQQPVSETAIPLPAPGQSI